MAEHWIPTNPKRAFRIVHGLSVSNNWTWRNVKGQLNIETEANFCSESISFSINSQYLSTTIDDQLQEKYSK